MVEEISLLIICVFCGLLALISAITTIIKRKEKTVFIPLLITVLAIGGSVYAGMAFTQKSTGTTDVEEKDTVADILSHIDFADSLIEIIDTVKPDTISVESEKYHDSSFLDSIKTIQPKKKKIPEAYFYSKGSSNNRRMPLIYPYSIVMETGNSATIKDETNVENAYISTDGSKLVIGDVVQFLYNQLFLIGKTQDETNMKYFFLKFDTGKLTSFETEKGLKKHLQNMGIGYPDKFFTPKEYYTRF